MVQWVRMLPIKLDNPNSMACLIETNICHLQDFLHSPHIRLGIHMPHLCKTKTNNISFLIEKIILILIPILLLGEILQSALLPASSSSFSSCSLSPSPPFPSPFSVACFPSFFLLNSFSFPCGIDLWAPACFSSRMRVHEVQSAKISDTPATHHHLVFRLMGPHFERSCRS